MHISSWKSLVYQGLVTIVFRLSFLSVLARRLAEKSTSEMIYFMSSGTWHFHLVRISLDLSWGQWLQGMGFNTLHTSFVYSCTSSTSNKPHNTCQAVCLQFLQPVADTGWGRLAQRFTFCQQQEIKFGECGLLRCGRLKHPSSSLHSITCQY